MLRRDFKQISATNNCGWGCKIDVTIMPYLSIKNHAGLSTDGALYFEYKDY